MVPVIQIAKSLCFSRYDDGYLNFVYPKLKFLLIIFKIQLLKLF